MKTVGMLELPMILDYKDISYWQPESSVKSADDDSREMLILVTPGVMEDIALYFVFDKDMQVENEPYPVVGKIEKPGRVKLSDEMLKVVAGTEVEKAKSIKSLKGSIEHSGSKGRVTIVAPPKRKYSWER